MREKLIKVIEEMAAAENFDESKYNEFYELLNTLKGNRGLIGVAADEITEYYAWWRQNKKHIPRNDEEATEIRENLRLLAAGLQRNISNFRSFEHLRKELEGEDLRPKRYGQRLEDRRDVFLPLTSLFREWPLRLPRNLPYSTGSILRKMTIHSSCVH